MKSLPFGGVCSGKISWRAILQCLKLRPNREKWGWGTDNIWNIWICKLVINKHKNMCVGVYWSDICVPGRKLLWWLKDIECMAGGEKEDLKKDVIFCYLTFFCVSLQSFLCGDMTTSILRVIDKHLPRKWSTSKKQWTKSSSTWKNFFTALVVSWGLSRIVRTIIIWFTECCHLLMVFLN